MWKIIGKTLNPNRDKSQNMINRLLVNGKNITDDHQIAEAMNNFFCFFFQKKGERAEKVLHLHKYRESFISINHMLTHAIEICFINT